MSQENVEVVKWLYEGTTARLEPPPELYDADFELDVRDFAPDFGVLQGLEASQDALRGYWDMFEDFQVEIEEVIHADEEQVVTAVRDGGQPRGSDAEVWNRFFHVWTFGDGKVVRLSIHTDRSRALEAAALRE
jgi:ketosteroid isomerase-like protein